MPLNASSVECESKKFAFTGFNNVAFGCINDQFQTVTQEPANSTQHTLARTRCLCQNGKVVRVSGKLMASFLKLFLCTVASFTVAIKLRGFVVLCQLTSSLRLI
jgi:hypothetical protein